MSSAGRGRRSAALEGEAVLSIDESADIATRVLWALMRRAGGSMVFKPEELDGQGNNELYIRGYKSGEVRVEILEARNS